MYLVSRPITRTIIGVILLSLFLSACMVGPNFRTPSGFRVKRYTEKPLPKKTASAPSLGGQSQQFISGKDLPELWWELFRSPAINSLIRKGLANSPNLSSAMAALRQAKENLNVEIGNTLWPAVDSQSFAQRQRYSTTNIGNVGGAKAFTFNLFSTTLNLSYNVDVFGGSRRKIESLRATVDNQQFAVIAAYLTLTSNIVTTAINVGSFQEQIKVTRELIREQQTLLNILNKQFELGGISKANVLTQQTLLEQTKATLPPLEKSLAQNEHALSVLAGSFPDEPLPKIDLDKLKLPVILPVSVPSLLIRQRPDIRAAEATLHSACAEIGVATAALFPKLDITAYYGFISSSLGNLFSHQNSIWSIMATVTQPVFHGGALLAQRRAAIAAYQQADAQYRQTVLQGFQNVADVLRALETDARALQAQALAEESARLSLKLTWDQYRLGGASYINLLNVQQQYLQTRINRVQAQAARYADTAALFQALGGGWWHKPWCVKECL